LTEKNEKHILKWKEVGKMGNEQKINLTIASGSGEYEDDFNQNMKIHAIKTVAMAHLQLDPSQKASYVLTFNGAILDENKTLFELQISDNSVLILEPKEATKI